jgi:hypothetical protein
MRFAVIIEDLCGAQVLGVSDVIAKRDAVNGEYRFTFGIHKLRIILDPGEPANRDPSPVAESAALLPAL